MSEMKTTAERLKELMKSRNLRQIDILRKVEPYCEKYKIKLGKSDLSQYINGKTVPGQSKLSILGLALGVSEGWLMGLPVPMERDENEKEPATRTDDGLSESDVEIFKIIDSLSEDKKEEAIRYLRYLSDRVDN